MGDLVRVYERRDHCAQCGGRVPVGEINHMFTDVCRACTRHRWAFRVASAIVLGIVFTICFAGFAHADATLDDFQRHANKFAPKTVAAIVITRRFGSRQQPGASEVLMRVGSLKVFRVVVRDSPNKRIHTLTLYVQEGVR